MKKTAILFFTLIFCAITMTFAQTEQKKIALVIGNSNYQHGGSLKNPVNDAELMKTTLQELGFTVIIKKDANLKTMQLATAEFTNKIKNYDIALFYYAGHGIQVDGTNYLIPIDAKLDDKVMCQFEAFDINFINKAFMTNSDNINIMILDACRDNPYRSWMRGGSRGFVAVGNQPAGTIIAFATREGETASDGTGNNGLYTEILVQEMKNDQNITEVFQNTRVQVLQKSGNTQCPQEWNMLTGNFYFTQKENNNNNQNNSNSQNNNNNNFYEPENNNTYKAKGVLMPKYSKIWYKDVSIDFSNEITVSLEKINAKKNNSKFVINIENKSIHPVIYDNSQSYCMFSTEKIQTNNPKSIKIKPGEIYQTTFNYNQQEFNFLFDKYTFKPGIIILEGEKKLKLDDIILEIDENKIANKKQKTKNGIITGFISTTVLGILIYTLWYYAN